MTLQAIVAAASVVLVPTLATAPNVARRMVYLPGAAWFTSAVGFLAMLAAILLLIGAVQSALAIALSAPLFQLGLVHVAFRVFVRFRGREPVDAAFNWRSEIPADRLYALVVTLGGILPILFLFAHLD